MIILCIIIYYCITLIYNCAPLIKNLFNEISKIDAVIIVAFITGVITIVSNVIMRILDSREETKRYLYSKREEAYIDFISMVYKLQKQTKNKIKYSDTEMQEDISKFSEKLTLWGSNKTIKKWLKFREYSINGNNNSTDILFSLEDIIFEIRNDMGQKKGIFYRLNKGDILKFFVNDVDKYK